MAAQDANPKEQQTPAAITQSANHKQTPVPAAEPGAPPVVTSRSGTPLAYQPYFPPVTSGDYHQRIVDRIRLLDRTTPPWARKFMGSNARFSAWAKSAVFNGTLLLTLSCVLVYGANVYEVQYRELALRRLLIQRNRLREQRKQLLNPN